MVNKSEPFTIKLPSGKVVTIGTYTQQDNDGRWVYTKSNVRRAKHFVKFCNGYAIQIEAIDKLNDLDPWGYVYIHEQDTGDVLIAPVKFWLPISAGGKSKKNNVSVTGDQYFLSEKYMLKLKRGK